MNKPFDLKLSVLRNFLQTKVFKSTSLVDKNPFSQHIGKFQQSAESFLEERIVLTRAAPTGGYFVLSIRKVSANLSRRWRPVNEKIAEDKSICLLEEANLFKYLFEVIYQNKKL